MGNSYKASGKSKRKRRRKKKKSGSFLIFFIVFIIIAGCSGYVAWYLFMPSNDYEDFHTYYNIPSDEITVILCGVRLDLTDGPVKYNGAVCFPVDFVKQYIDQYIWWDPVALKLTVTMPDKVMRFIPGQINYSENGSPAAGDAPVYLINETPYLPVELLTQIYHISLDYHSDNNIVIMNFLDEDRGTGIISSDNTVLRFSPDKKAPLMYRFSRDERVYVYGENGDYTAVMAENGLIGFVPSKAVADAGAEKGTAPAPSPQYPALPPIQGKVNMIWDQIYNSDGNAARTNTAVEDGLDVISPTWLTFDLSLTGDIISLADADYVNWAHGSGCQVWPLISDLSSDASSVLNQEISHSILSDTDTRQHVIDQLMELIAEYDLDGLNIDFEYVQQADAAAYLQFIRELGPYMKTAGKYLSVDMYNPDPQNYWSKYYNREEVGKAVDFICVMTYDEYGSSSATSGPVASMPFVRNGIGLTLQEVPKEKVILGLPYFVRVWREETADGAVSTTSRAYDMDSAYKLFTDNNAVISWDDAYGTYYAVYTDGDNVVYKAWLEDARSIEEKLKYMQSADLAGVAGWSWGLENSGVWDLLRQYVN